MSQDALGVISNPSNTHQRTLQPLSDETAQQIRPVPASSFGNDENLETLTMTVLEQTLVKSATAADVIITPPPLTPKSFHSTRSSFKKISIATEASAMASVVNQQLSGNAHIYDFITLSSLNSSSRRSSFLNHVNNNATNTNSNHNNNHDLSDVMISSPLSFGYIDLLVEPETISYSAEASFIVKEPIIIRGAGNVTIFGVCNKFSEQFPNALNAKLAPEEFRDTIKQVNTIVNKELENSFKWLIVGSLFCCCTLGFSLFPVIYLNKKAKLCINKLLEIENQRLYTKLGLKWRLSKVKCANSNSALFEYVLFIEFLPVLSLYHPD